MKSERLSSLTINLPSPEFKIHVDSRKARSITRSLVKQLEEANKSLGADTKTKLEQLAEAPLVQRDATPEVCNNINPCMLT